MKTERVKELLSSGVGAYQHQVIRDLAKEVLGVEEYFKFIQEICAGAKTSKRNSSKRVVTRVECRKPPKLIPLKLKEIKLGDL